MTSSELYKYLPETFFINSGVFVLFVQLKKMKEHKKNVKYLNFIGVVVVLKCLIELLTQMYKKSIDFKINAFFNKYVVFVYFTFTSSTSKISVASGGITPPAP